jgi:hypothetical protein
LEASGGALTTGRTRLREEAVDLGTLGISVTQNLFNLAGNVQQNYNLAGLASEHLLNGSIAEQVSVPSARAAI